jgi:hypothetical protein
MNSSEKRVIQRFPYKYPVIYISLGHEAHPPTKENTDSEIMDLSDNGMRLRVNGRKLAEGSLLLVRVPVSEVPVSVPSLAQVRWIKEVQSGTYEAGLRFVVE